MTFQRRGRLWVPEAPHIIRNRTIEIGMDVGMRFEGWWDVKLIDAKTKKVKRHLHFRNLITNAGLDGLGANSISGLVNWFGVGTGNTAPTNGDTTLQTPTGARIQRGALTITAGPSNLYYSAVCTALFLEATANGNLTEIGSFSANAAGVMWTRQLFKDGTGTPTVIVKTAADQLQVTYELRLYSPTVDVAGNVVVSGINYAFVNRAANINSSTAWGSGPIGSWSSAGGTVPNAYETDVLGTTSGNPGGTSAAATSAAAAAYVASSLQRDFSYIWDPGVGNFPTGVGSLAYGTPGPYGGAAPFQVNFSPKIPKTSTKRLTLVARLSWARYP